MARNDTQAGRGDESTLRRLTSLLEPYKGRLAVTVVMAIGLMAVNIIVPLIIKVVFNDVLEAEHQNWSLLWTALSVLLTLYIARNLLYFYSKYGAVSIGEDLSFSLRKQLFERLQQMNLQYYRNHAPGQLSSRVMNDSFVIQQFIQDQLPKLLQSSLLFFGVTAAIYAMNWQLALASTILLPLHLITFNYFRGPIKRASRSASESMASATGNLIEKFLGIEVVKGFTAEGRENQAFQEAIDVSRRNQLRGHKFQVGQKVAADLLIGLGMVALLGFGAYQVMAQGMLTGDLVAFFWYVKMLYPTITELMASFAKLPKATASAERIFEVMETGAAERESGQGLRPRVRGSIEFDHVSFRYSDGGPWVLSDISFSIAAGQVCGIVGPSGSGKSTLANLIPRFNDPQRGRIRIDGHEAKDLDLTHLRQEIGFAFQECFLFNSSILENLRYAWPDASLDYIIEMAQRTGADDFIRRLPDDYNTLVGESGVSLSRGEKQLLTLTRAMLKNPQILILDEATSSIDEARESRVIPEILDFMQGKTTFMITHRPELLRHSNVVLQLSDGRVASFGPTPSTEKLVSKPPFAPESPLPRAERQKRSSGQWPTVTPMLLAAVLGMGGLTGPAAVAQDEKQDEAQAEQQQEEAAEQDEQDEDAAEGGSNDGGSEGGEANDEAQEAELEQSDGGEDEGGDQEGADSQAQESGEPDEAGSGNEQQQSSEQASEQSYDDDGPALSELSRPDNAGRFLEQSGLSSNEVAEIVQMLEAQAQTMGYRQRSSRLTEVLPDGPDQLRGERVMVRREDGQHHVLQLGYRPFSSQPPHIWLYGLTLADQQLSANGDLNTLVEAVDQLKQKNQQRKENLQFSDLESGKITLSYIAVSDCLQVLQSMGYNVVQGGNAAEVQNLPLVMQMPATENAGLVGQQQYTIGRQGGGQEQIGQLNDTEGAPMTDLLVFYDPSRPEQFGNLKTLIQDQIDTPARQIVIEAMVLELSESTLEDMGVEWHLEDGFDGRSNLDNISNLQFGRLPNFGGGEQPTFDIEIDNISNHWRAEIQALVRDGRAKILSRPSVLTLNNRQAFIRVGEDIPIATSAKGATRGDLVSFEFDYIPVGISLNVRPRVSSEGERISMQINGDVSSTVPDEDLVIRDNQGNVSARAPQLSQRRVQTYARVANNTPFIIGGLISQDNIEQHDKVPVLGDVPVVGELFKNSRIDQVKREVIIVLTPYVLPESQIVGRNMPKDEDTFDSFGNELFRDAYRIRSEDVFELGFLTENQTVRRMQDLADEVAGANPRLAEEYPVSEFAGESVPGEEVLVYRQMYEVIKRQNLSDEVPFGQIIFFEEHGGAETGFEVEFIEPYLKEQAKELEEEGLIEKRGVAALQANDKALALTYTDRRASAETGEMLEQPVPEVRLLDCPDDETWDRLLWELNQPDEQGRDRYTILIRDEENLVRLKRALLLKRTVELNAGGDSLTLENFSVGRQLLLPEANPEMVRLIDAEVANYFYLTEQYYPALQKELRDAGQQLRQMLKRPDISQYLENPEKVEALEPAIEPEVPSEE